MRKQSHGSRRVSVRLAVASAAIILTVTACGDDDDGGGVVANLQQQVIDQTVAQVEGAGADIDESCLEGMADRLSDADAQAILDGDSASVSAEGSALGQEMLDECVSMDG